jgi:prolyl 4-hydroxylase
MPGSCPVLPASILAGSSPNFDTFRMTPMTKTEHFGARAFSLDAVLTRRECTSWIQTGEELGFTAAPITTLCGFMLAPEVRNNTRVVFDDQSLANELWQRLTPWIPGQRGQRAVGLNERLRIYRYTSAQYFRWHRDGSFVRSERERSLLTLMIYLNGDFEGGTTDFDVKIKTFSVVPGAGSALLFEHSLLHQGAPVRTGTKYVLRTDVMFERAP